MKLNLCKKKSNLKKNNKGMALVTVIVAIGFIAALVSILMLTTLVNFKMKNVNERSKDTFYSAEQAIDEINVGLQHIVSESMSEAYMEIMTNYGDSSYTPEAKTELLTTKYYEALWDRLEDPNMGNGYYDVSILEGFLKPTTKWHTPSGATDGGYGAIVVAVDDEEPNADAREKKFGRMITYEKSGVVLKNLKVYYKDQMGFVSVVQTDIRLTYPEFDFADTSELPTIPQYAFVADGGAAIEATGDLTLGGNIYANNLEISGGTKTNKLNVYTEADQVITSKYDINFDNFTNYTGKDKSGSDAVDTPVTIRARNIVVNSSDVRLVGKTLLANDMNIKGKDSDVVLVGAFTGYGIGNNMNATDVDLAWNTSNINADWSSAILINGKNTTLNMAGLDEITLYGHSYIGTGKAELLNSKNNTETYSNEFQTDTLKNGSKYTDTKRYADIAMGESIAVKTNQMLYLVPASAIGVDSNGKSMFNRNPLTQAEYLELMKEVQDGDRELTSSSVVVSELGTDLSDFVKDSTGALNVQTIWARVNDEGVGSLVYFYMTFDDEAKANAYYARRYEGSKEKFDNYTKSYLKNIKWPNTSNIMTFNMAANAMDMDDTTGELSRMAASSITTVSTSDEHKNASIRFLNEFKGMCNRLESKPKLRRDESLAGKTETDLYQEVVFADTVEADTSAMQNVYENIVSASQMQEFLNDVQAGVDEYEGILMQESGGVISIIDNNDGGKKVAIIDTTTGTTKLSDSVNKDVILVITEGDVEVERNFEGLILANGKVTFSGSDLEIKASPEAVRKALQYGFETSTGDVKTVAYTLADGTQYTYNNAATAGYTSDYALGGLITYENWKKD